MKKNISTSYSAEELRGLLDEIIESGQPHLEAIGSVLEFLAWSIRIVGEHNIGDIRNLRRELTRTQLIPEEKPPPGRKRRQPYES